MDSKVHFRPPTARGTRNGLRASEGHACRRNNCSAIASTGQDELISTSVEQLRLETSIKPRGHGGAQLFSQANRSTSSAALYTPRRTPIATVATMQSG